MSESRKQISEWIIAAIGKRKDSLQQEFIGNQQQIGYLVIDDLLPADFVQKIYQFFTFIAYAQQKKTSKRINISPIK